MRHSIHFRFMNEVLYQIFRSVDEVAQLLALPAITTQSTCIPAMRNSACSASCTITLNYLHCLAARCLCFTVSYNCFVVAECLNKQHVLQQLSHSISSIRRFATSYYTWSLYFYLEGRTVREYAAGTNTGSRLAFVSGNSPSLGSTSGE